MKNRIKIRSIIVLLIMVFSLSGCSNGNVTNTVSPDVATVKTTIPDKINTDSQVVGTFKSYYFDVGQGDSIYLKMPNGEDVLIDAGDNSHGDDVVKYLKDLKVDDLEAVISTHPDADHSGGLDVVFQNFKVESVYAPKVTHTTQTFLDFITEVKKQGLKIIPVKAGVKLPFAGVNAIFVGPVKDYGSELNDWNAVLKVSFDKTSFLFTGDAPIKSENDMIASNQDLKADVLKLGHHGSDTSTSQEFLNVVNPKYAIISVGKDNKYGHPKQSIMERLTSDGIEVYRTDKQGTIIATSDGKNIVFNNKQIQNNTILNIPIKNPVTSTNNIKTTITVTVDSPTPNKNDTINIDVSGNKGIPYTAVCHYKSKDTTYNGTIGTLLPIKIGGASSGYKVVIDVKYQIDGKTYTLQTSFTPK